METEKTGKNSTECATNTKLGPHLSHISWAHKKHFTVIASVVWTELAISLTTQHNTHTLHMGSAGRPATFSSTCSER